MEVFRWKNNKHLHPSESRTELFLVELIWNESALSNIFETLQDFTKTFV